MKKAMILTVGMSILGGMVLGGFSANAEEDNPTATSQATLNVLVGPLKMTSVDNVDFEEVEIDGTVQKIEGKDILVKFSDYRGAKNEGFELQVKSDNVFVNNGLNLSLTPKNSNSEQAELGESFEVTNEFKQVASGDKAAITGEATDYVLGIGTSVEVLKTAKPGIHQTVLTWDLSAVPNE